MVARWAGHSHGLPSSHFGLQPLTSLLPASSIPHPSHCIPDGGGLWHHPTTCQSQMLQVPRVISWHSSGRRTLEPTRQGYADPLAGGR